MNEMRLAEEMGEMGRSLVFEKEEVIELFFGLLIFFVFQRKLPFGLTLFHVLHVFLPSHF